MHKPKLYVEVGEEMGSTSRAISEVEGEVTRVKHAIDKKYEEADLAVTDSIQIAERIRKETEHTKILIIYLPKDAETVKLFARRHPKRFQPVEALHFRHFLAKAIEHKSGG